MIRRLIAAAAVAALTVGGLSASALASGHKAVPASAKVLAVTRVYVQADGTPFVSGTYQCTGKFTHLWVSVKQGKGNLRHEGSGSKSRSWYQNTWDQKLNCDGKTHTRVFTLAPTGDTGKVRIGHRAYVQFCMVMANHRKDLGPHGHPAFDSNMRYRHVQRFPG
jgi:hypothetical protein